MVASITTEVTNQQDATGTCPSSDPNSLKGCIESPMPQENHHAVEVPSFDYAGGLGPYFSTLPRELRDQIFSNLLASGYPQFTRVSRAMNVEGMALVYKKGVYRINLGYDICEHRPGLLTENCTGPIRKAADNIRTLSIKVEIKDFTSYRSRHVGEFQHVDTFMGFSLKRRSCNIRRCCNQYARRYSGIFLWNMILIARGLMEYETVVLHIDTDKFLDFEPEQMMKGEIERIFTFRCVSKRHLEPFLGEEIVRSDKDGLRLVFHPRKAWGEAVREAPRATDVHKYMKNQMGRDYYDLWIGRSIRARFSDLDADSRKDLLRLNSRPLTGQSDLFECEQSQALQQKQNFLIDMWLG